MAWCANTVEDNGDVCLPAYLRGGAVAAQDQSTVNAEQRTATHFRELRSPVHRYLVCLRITPLEADEIVQETFLQLFQHLCSGFRVNNARAWAFRVAHNMAVNCAESQKRVMHATPEEWQGLAATLVDPALNPEERLLEKERITRLHAATEELSPQQRYCLHLRAEGFRYREIAEILDLTVPTVAEYVRRAIARLSKEIPWTT
jgi:RNA polymerase sigma-70 factor (ECF subfamily)